MRYLGNETIWVNDNSIFVIRGSNSTNIGNKKIYCQCPLRICNMTIYFIFIYLFTNFVMNDRDSPQSSSPNIGAPKIPSIHIIHLQFSLVFLSCLGNSPVTYLAMLFILVSHFCVNKINSTVTCLKEESAKYKSCNTLSCCITELY